MVLLRSAMKQGAAAGYLVSFMCRPGLPNTLASGWHLHQSVLDRKTKGTCLRVTRDDKHVLSPLGRNFLAGVLRTRARRRHLRRQPSTATSAYHGVNSMAPIQAVWARDNRGVMVQ
jgi:glutamine synthetase